MSLKVLKTDILNKMDEEEIVMPNGLGLAKVTKILKQDTMVSIVINHWRDLEINKDYNFEFVVINKLLDNAWFFTNSDFKTLQDRAIGKFIQQVNINKNLISKVKEFIQYG